MKKRIKLELSEEDAIKVKHLLSQICHPRGPAHTLDDLMTRWILFSSEVERGYNFGIEDYINDLSIRDLLEEVIQSLSASGREQVATIVHEIDERFYRATKEVESSLITSLSSGHDGLWWKRIPALLKEELETDLRNCQVLT